MATTEKHILNRLYIIAGCMFIFAVAVAVQLLNIQIVEGERYNQLAEERTYRNFTIPANRGNLYDTNGNLLATSISKYDIRFDAVTVTDKNFEENITALSRELSNMLGQTPAHWSQKLRTARVNKNRYLLITRNLGYTDYMKLKSFPMFKLGTYKGGMITEQRTVREHPLGAMAARTVGYERKDDQGFYTRVGLEGAFGPFLEGKDGHRLKQKIAKGQWKPISDNNEVEPKDGYDVISTIDVNIQDIAHHALLAQLEKYEADHGTVVVMETKTGEIKAISNLGRTSKGTYYEKLNYAVGETHEPGSTFKLMAMIVALEDKVIDTSTVVDTENGIMTIRRNYVRDSKRGGYGKISAGRAFEVSSNVGIVKLIYDNYKDKPQKFIDGLNRMNLNEPLGLSIKGEGAPYIPTPGDKTWSALSLPWMAYGYGSIQITPLQTLTFYNAVANGGVMVKPRFIKEIKEWDKTIVKNDLTVINPSIASAETISKVQEMLKNVVEKGTGKSLYSPNFSMAGKTGTAQTEYWMPDWQSNRRYISSFVGYFPAEDPKYTSIVIIHKPKVSTGYYGADVSGPVFKRIAQKIYTDTPVEDEIESLDIQNELILNDFEKYYTTSQNEKRLMPDVKGMPVMDAMSILENLGLDVKVNGNGYVKDQSIAPGEKIKTKQKVALILS
ncbi:PASTA domain-containing protein [Antarcticibacterium flavum]|uniref:PASTA domain-containing protein n=1 Tax=Antarcticibacterium flavum TaxID=2058175 RepID=A0A5B7X3A5_9FLAO|nr:penicillin-binding protein [Antarcticibacterium flavum]MCM4161515.1 penicillin-binding protein [Antarcticibacterium sp. W02-3]QCY69118.1 PASTA domain-containing protein [Antarcticibacterium flavum]